MIKSSRFLSCSYFVPLFIPLETCKYKLTLSLILQTILKIPGFKDDILTHLLSGLGAGFVAVCIGSPVDVVRCPIISAFLMLPVTLW
jgi:hypothetical protein